MLLDIIAWVVLIGCILVPCMGFFALVGDAFTGCCTDITNPCLAYFWVAVFYGAVVFVSVLCVILLFLWSIYHLMV